MGHDIGRSVLLFFVRRKLGLFVASCAFLADWLSKAMALRLPYEPIAAVPGVLNLSLSFNRGISFSWLSNVETPLTVFGTTYYPEQYMQAKLALVALLASLFFLWWMGQSEGSRWLKVGAGLIMGGALGNMVDRLVHGAVVDFLDLYYGDTHFFIFNIADAAISMGVVCIFIDAFYAYQNQKKER